MAVYDVGIEAMRKKHHAKPLRANLYVDLVIKEGVTLPEADKQRQEWIVG